MHDHDDHGDEVVVIYTCNDDGTIDLKEGCDDSCGTCTVSEKIQDGGCYLVDGSVHTATCNGTTATVHIYEDHQSCDDDLKGPSFRSSPNRVQL